MPSPTFVKRIANAFATPYRFIASNKDTRQAIYVPLNNTNIPSGTYPCCCPCCDCATPQDQYPAAEDSIHATRVKGCCAPPNSWVLTVSGLANCLNGSGGNGCLNCPGVANTLMTQLVGANDANNTYNLYYCGRSSVGSYDGSLYQAYGLAGSTVPGTPNGHVTSAMTWKWWNKLSSPFLNCDCTGSQPAGTTSGTNGIVNIYPWIELYGNVTAGVGVVRACMEFLFPVGTGTAPGNPQSVIIRSTRFTFPANSNCCLPFTEGLDSGDSLRATCVRCPSICTLSYQSAIDASAVQFSATPCVPP